MSLYRKFLLILPLSLIFAITGWAQTASFEGTVKGPDGKPLVGAQVKIERLDVKGNYPTKTDKKGHYFYGGLPGGSYKITIATDGKDRITSVAGADANAMYAQRLAVGIETFRRSIGELFLG